ncbi:hypothetical protein D3C71_779640 [compost metagenome]
MNDPTDHVADPEALAIGEKTIPLRSIRLHFRHVVDFLPEFLNIDHFGADRGRGACLCLQIGCRRKMIRMRMRIQNPLHRELLTFDIGEDCICARCLRAPRFLIVIEHRVDDRAISRFRIAHHILNAAGALVVETFDQRIGVHYMSSGRLKKSVSICPFLSTTFPCRTRPAYLLCFSFSLSSGRAVSAFIPSMTERR